MAEQKAFILTTLLSDIALLEPGLTEEILECQLKVMNRVSTSIIDLVNSQAHVDKHKKSEQDLLKLIEFKI